MAKILIIDDEDLVRGLLKTILERKGYDVAAAADGEAGQKLLSEQEFDLLITDLIMPGREGLELIQEISRDFPNLPIIAISGGGRMGATSSLHMARLFGASRTLAKPLRAEELLEAVEEVLKNPSSGSGSEG